MELLLLVIGIVALAWWKEDYFLHIIAAASAITFGTFWIQEDPDATYLVTGIAMVAIGFYMLIRTVIRLVRND